MLQSACLCFDFVCLLSLLISFARLFAHFNTVVVRIRPPIQEDFENPLAGEYQDCTTTLEDGRTLLLSRPTYDDRDFTVDCVLGPMSSQRDTYDVVASEIVEVGKCLHPEHFRLRSRAGLCLRHAGILENVTRLHLPFRAGCFARVQWYHIGVWPNWIWQNVLYLWPRNGLGVRSVALFRFRWVVLTSAFFLKYSANMWFLLFCLFMCVCELRMRVTLLRGFVCWFLSQNVVPSGRWKRSMVSSLGLFTKFSTTLMRCGCYRYSISRFFVVFCNIVFLSAVLVVSVYVSFASVSLPPPFQCVLCVTLFPRLL